MTQFACKCGSKISLTVAPNANEGSLLWDDVFEEWQRKRSSEIEKFISLVLKGKIV